eukprot:jgi/Ulvmu1/5772/UM025_0026.1
MDFEIDDDLIDDACELEQEQHGFDAMLPDDEDVEAEPAGLRSAGTKPRSKSLTVPSGAITPFAIAGSQPVPRSTTTPAPLAHTPIDMDQRTHNRTPAAVGLQSTQLSMPTSIKTIDLAAELLAMASTGPAIGSQGQASEMGPKRPRQELDARCLQEEEIKPVRKFRPLLAHDAAMFTTPAHVKRETFKRNDYAGHIPRTQERQNTVFHTLQAARASGVRCMLVSGDSATESVYCRMRPLHKPPPWWQPAAVASSRTQLLGAPIEDMLHEIEGEQLVKAHARLEALRAGLDLEISSDDEDDPSRQGGAAVAQPEQQQLWVDAHAPRSYLQLLSAETANARVLSWLKSWDSVVFGKPRQEKSGGGLLAGTVLSSVAEKQDRRPECKGILISGPPGVGKTTLAHVAARHCGYRVVEINASDERSRGALLSAAAAAVQMQPVLGERRPNCLVIDEIDGALGGAAGRAGGGAVAAIAEIIRTGRVAVKDNQTGDGGGGKGKGGSVPLLRPVICICNDLYTPALRPLREVAEVLEVGPPEDRMLRARLREVCRREHANVAEEALRHMASKASGDIRSCLNTLQLLVARHGHVSASHVAGAAVGEKDMTAAPFEVWEQLLTTRRPRGDDMLRCLMAFGEHDLIMRGVHENMLDLPYMDQDLERSASMANWLSDFDLWQRRCMRNMQFDLMPLLPVAVLACANLCRVHTRVRLRWPKQAPAAAKRCAAARATVTDWAASLPPNAATFSLPYASLLLAPALATVLSPPPETLNGLLLGKGPAAATERLVSLMLDYRIVYDLGQGITAARTGFSPEADVDAGTPLKPPVHALHAYDMEEPTTRRTLSEALRTVLLHKRQLQEARRLELRAEEKAVAAQRQRAAAGGCRGAPAASARICAMFGMAPPPDAGAADTAALDAFGSAADGDWENMDCGNGRCDGAGTAQQGAGRAGARRTSDVRGAAGSATAMLRAARAPKVAAAGNWLTTMGSKAKKEKHRRVLAVDGEALQLPDGVSASQATGKLHFPVTFKFHEGYTNAVKRPLQMRDLFPEMKAASAAAASARNGADKQSTKR